MATGLNMPCTSEVIRPPMTECVPGTEPRNEPAPSPSYLRVQPSLGARVYRLRLAAGLTSAGLARLWGVDVARVYEIENEGAQITVPQLMELGIATIREVYKAAQR